MMLTECLEEGIFKLRVGTETTHSGVVAVARGNSVEGAGGPPVAGSLVKPKGNVRDDVGAGILQSADSQGVTDQVCYKSN